MNANPIVNVKNSTIESENNTELSENKKPVLNQNNTTELLRQYLDLEDKTSNKFLFLTAVTIEKGILNTKNLRD